MKQKRLENPLKPFLRNKRFRTALFALVSEDPSVDYEKVLGICDNEMRLRTIDKETR